MLTVLEMISSISDLVTGTPFESFSVHDGVDHTSVEGIADAPYAIGNMSVGLSDFETATPVL